jgi:hypothetical protein
VSASDLHPSARALGLSRRACGERAGPGAKPAGHHRRGHRTGPPRNAPPSPSRTSTRRGRSTACPAMPTAVRAGADPNVEALPQPLSRTPIDLEALARGYASQSDAMAQAQGLATGARVVGVRQPVHAPATLQGLVDQAARAKASIVLRGFANGSLRDTVAQVQGLIGSRQVAVQIDPLAFDRYAITRYRPSCWCAMAPPGCLRQRQLCAGRQVPADRRRREPGLRAGTHAALGTPVRPTRRHLPETDQGIGGHDAPLGHLDHARLLRHDADRRRRRSVRGRHRRRPSGQSRYSGHGEHAQCIECRAGLHHDATGNHLLRPAQPVGGGQCPPGRLRRQHR